ncbi:MAG: DEAD/DEAH box helicase [Caldilineaceae bacterium]|nr:DEAD/DEAH box helicase [Caldilineaceae bacterium]
MLTLRPYQRQTIDAVRGAWRDGCADVLAVLATGAGKTIVFLALMDEILNEQPQARFLLIAHRKELIEQPAERIAQFWPQRAAAVGIVMAGQNECDRQIVIGTIQTLQSAGRLEQVFAHGPIDYLIIDETHHSNAEGYQTVIQTLKDMNPRLKHLGVTATPVRADGGGLPYDKKAVHLGVKELVRDGWLAPPRWLAIQTGINLSGVAVHGSGDSRDFSQRGLVDVFETDNCFDLVAESHTKYADGRKALAFVVSVEGAYRLADTLNSAGISAIAADGNTPKDERRQILSDFRAGRYDVLVNCALFTEGLDVPEVSCIHQVRPTKSDSLYLQMVGRALRTFPGKEDALILDYAPADARNITMLGDVLGVEAKKEAYLEESVEEGFVIAGFTFDGDFKWMTGNPMEIVSRQLDYLNMSPWRWSKPDGKTGPMVLGLGPGDDGTDRTLIISEPGETMNVWLVAKSPEVRWHRAYHVMTGSFEECSEWANDYAEQRGNVTLARKQQRWRNGLASEGQIKFARNLGVWKPGMTKGECAEAITCKLALNALRREERKAA